MGDEVGDLRATGAKAGDTNSSKCATPVETGTPEEAVLAMVRGDAGVDDVEMTSVQGGSYCLAAVAKIPTVQKTVGAPAVRSVGGQHSTGGWLWGYR